MQGGHFIIEKSVGQSSAFLLDSSREKPLYFQKLRAHRPMMNFATLVAALQNPEIGRAHVCSSDLSVGQSSAFLLDSSREKPLYFQKLRAHRPMMNFATLVAALQNP